MGRRLFTTGICLSLALLLGAGCPGWPAPEKPPRKRWREIPDEVTEHYIQDKGGWINLETFTGPNRKARAGRVLESPWIEVKIEGKVVLGNPTVLLEVGADSSRLETMPVDGCFPGLVTDELVPLPKAEGPPRRGCKEKGYGLFRYCPSHPAYRLPIYLSAYSLRGWIRGKTVEARRLVSVAQVLNRESMIKPLGVLCHHNRTGAVRLEMPYELFKTEWFKAFVKVKVIVDAREATGEQNEATYLRLRALSK